MKKQDRSWVRPPNTMSKPLDQKKKKRDKNYPSKISYWMDKNGEAQLYTPEQLAVCNILMNLNVILNKSLTLAENIQTMDKDVTVGILAQQEYAQFKTFETSVYGHFVELLAAAPDITFGEFLNFISQGNDTNAFLKMGKKKLKSVVKNKNTDVTTFYRSDKLKK
jgi:hypothetical protein